MSNFIPISEVRESVREFYAERARTGSTCCTPTNEPAAADCCRPNPFHEATLLAGIPNEIATFTLGCGDAISLAQLQPGETVVDLGSGGGLECFIAARQVGPSGRAIGVDMTPEMLSKAWANAAKLKMQNVDFRFGYLEALPVPDRSVDAVISNCVINLAPDKQAVFREMARVLKPGGRIAVSDVVARGEIDEALQRDMALWGGCYSGALDAETYAHQLRDAGFADVVVALQADAADGHPALTGRIFSAAITARMPAA